MLLLNLLFLLLPLGISINNTYENLKCYKNVKSYVAIILLLEIKNILDFIINLESKLTKVFVKYLTIISHHYPLIFNLLGLLIGLFNLLVDTYHKLIEYRLFIVSIKFIIYFFFMDPTSLDIYAFILLLDSICIIYTIYVKYIDIGFTDRYPKIHVLLEKISKVLYIISMLISIRTVFINWRKSSDNVGYDYPDGNGGPGSWNDNAGYGPPADNGGPSSTAGNGGTGPSAGNGGTGPSGGNGGPGPSGSNGGPGDSGGPSLSSETVRKKRGRNMTEEEKEAHEADRKAKRNQSDRLKRANLSKANPVVFQSQSKKTELARLRNAETKTEEEQKRLDMLRGEMNEDARLRRAKKKANLSEKTLEKDQMNKSNEYRLDADLLDHPYTDQRLVKEWKDAFGD